MAGNSATKPGATEDKVVFSASMAPSFRQNANYYGNRKDVYAARRNNGQYGKDTNTGFDFSSSLNHHNIIQTTFAIPLDDGEVVESTLGFDAHLDSDRASVQAKFDMGGNTLRSIEVDQSLEQTLKDRPAARFWLGSLVDLVEKETGVSAKDIKLERIEFTAPSASADGSMNVPLSFKSLLSEGVGVGAICGVSLAGTRMILSTGQYELRAQLDIGPSIGAKLSSVKSKSGKKGHRVQSSGLLGRVSVDVIRKEATKLSPDADEVTTKYAALESLVQEHEKIQDHAKGYTRLKLEELDISQETKIDVDGNVVDDPTISMDERQAQALQTGILDEYYLQGLVDSMDDEALKKEHRNYLNRPTEERTAKSRGEMFDRVTERARELKQRAALQKNFLKLRGGARAIASFTQSQTLRKIAAFTDFSADVHQSFSTMADSFQIAKADLSAFSSSSSGASAFDVLSSGVGLIGGVLNFVGIVSSIGSLFGGGEDSSALKALSKQTNQLRKEMHERFDRLSEQVADGFSETQAMIGRLADEVRFLLSISENLLLQMENKVLRGVARVRGDITEARLELAQIAYSHVDDSVATTIRFIREHNPATLPDTDFTSHRTALYTYLMDTLPNRYSLVSNTPQWLKSRDRYEQPSGVFERWSLLQTAVHHESSQSVPVFAPTLAWEEAVSHYFYFSYLNAEKLFALTDHQKVHAMEADQMLIQIPERTQALYQELIENESVWKAKEAALIAFYEKVLSDVQLLFNAAIKARESLLIPGVEMGVTTGMVRLTDDYDATITRLKTDSSQKAQLETAVLKHMWNGYSAPAKRATRGYHQTHISSSGMFHGTWVRTKTPDLGKLDYYEPSQVVFDHLERTKYKVWENFQEAITVSPEMQVCLTYKQCFNEFAFIPILIGEAEHAHDFVVYYLNGVKCNNDEFKEINGVRLARYARGGFYIGKSGALSDLASYTSLSEPRGGGVFHGEAKKFRPHLSLNDDQKLKIYVDGQVEKQKTLLQASFNALYDEAALAELHNNAISDIKLLIRAFDQTWSISDKDHSAGFSWLIERLQFLAQQGLNDDYLNDLQTISAKDLVMKDLQPFYQPLAQSLDGYDSTDFSLSTIRGLLIRTYTEQHPLKQRLSSLNKRVTQYQQQVMSASQQQLGCSSQVETMNETVVAAQHEIDRIMPALFDVYSKTPKSQLATMGFETLFTLFDTLRAFIAEQDPLLGLPIPTTDATESHKWAPIREAADITKPWNVLQELCANPQTSITKVYDQLRKITVRELSSSLRTKNKPDHPLYLAAHAGRADVVYALLSFDAIVPKGLLESIPATPELMRMKSLLVFYTQLHTFNTDILIGKLLRLLHEHIPDWEDVGVDSPIIMLMGRTGSGKTTCINLAHGVEYEFVRHRKIEAREYSIPEISRRGDSYNSETLVPIPFHFKNKNVTMIDMPGLDDTGGESRRMYATLAGELLKQKFQRVQRIFFFLSESVLTDDNNSPMIDALNPLATLVEQDLTLMQSVTLVISKCSNFDSAEGIHEELTDRLEKAEDLPDSITKVLTELQRKQILLIPRLNKHQKTFPHDMQDQIWSQVSLSDRTIPLSSFRFAEFSQESRHLEKILSNMVEFTQSKQAVATRMVVEHLIASESTIKELLTQTQLLANETLTLEGCSSSDSELASRYTIMSQKQVQLVRLIRTSLERLQQLTREDLIQLEDHVDLTKEFSSTETVAELRSQYQIGANFLLTSAPLAELFNLTEYQALLASINNCDPNAAWPFPGGCALGTNTEPRTQWQFDMLILWRALTSINASIQTLPHSIQHLLIAMQQNMLQAALPQAVAYGSGQNCVYQWPIWLQNLYTDLPHLSLIVSEQEADMALLPVCADKATYLKVQGAWGEAYLGKEGISGQIYSAFLDHCLWSHTKSGLMSFAQGFTHQTLMETKTNPAMAKDITEVMDLLWIALCYGPDALGLHLIVAMISDRFDLSASLRQKISLCLLTINGVMGDFSWLPTVGLMALNMLTSRLYAYAGKTTATMALPPIREAVQRVSMAFELIAHDNPREECAEMAPQR